MVTARELESVAGQLDGLVDGLAAGANQQLEDRTAALAPAASVLQELAVAARQGRIGVEALPALIEIRRKTALLIEMLAYAHQVRTGVTGILAMLYGQQMGSRYAADGSPTLVSGPRVVAEA